MQDRTLGQGSLRVMLTKYVAIRCLCGRVIRSFSCGARARACVCVFVWTGATATHVHKNLNGHTGFQVGFHMISDDMEETMKKLNDVRAKRPKFVCVNDDMDDPSPELLEQLQLFYESFFPVPSRFELPVGAANPPPLQFSQLRPKVRAPN